MVALPVDNVQTVALVVHELATNAVTHGALHRGGGRPAVTWTVAQPAAGKMPVLDWRESGVPLAPEHHAAGAPSAGPRG